VILPTCISLVISTFILENKIFAFEKIIYVFFFFSCIVLLPTVLGGLSAIRQTAVTMNQSIHNPPDACSTHFVPSEELTNGFSSRDQGYAGGSEGSNAFPEKKTAPNGVHSQGGERKDAQVTVGHNESKQGVRLSPINIQMSSMKRFEEQIAGHGMVDGKVLLKHPDGRVLKPKQAPPKGTREVGFYESLAQSIDPTDEMIRRIVPTFYGIAISEKGDEFLVLRDVTQGMAQPTVIDVKLGRQTWLPDAPDKKVAQQKGKYVGTRTPLGFSVSGMIIHCASTSEGDQPVIRLDKQFGMSLKTKDVKNIPKLFFDVERSGPVNRDLLQTVINKMREVLKVFESQRKYNFYSSSLLMAYDAEVVRQVQQGNKEINGTEGGHTAQNRLLLLDRCVNVSIIDFANVIPSQERDDNFINGLKNLIQIFEEFL